MTTNNAKIMLFAGIIAVMILPMFYADVFAESTGEKNDEFELKVNFETKDDAKEYAGKLNSEIKSQYDEVQDAVKNNDDKLAEKSAKLEELKENAAYLISKYHPGTTSLGVTGDEYFEMIDEDHSLSQTVESVAGVSGVSITEPISERADTEDSIESVAGVSGVSITEPISERADTEDSIESEAGVSGVSITEPISERADTEDSIESEQIPRA